MKLVVMKDADEDAFTQSVVEFDEDDIEMVTVTPQYTETFKIFFKPLENGKKRTFYKNWKYNPDYDKYKVQEIIQNAQEKLPDMPIEIDFGDMTHENEGCDYNQYDENKILQVAPKRHKKNKKKKAKKTPKPEEKKQEKKQKKNFFAKMEDEL